MTKPIVIAHRGASGERPEHTRSAYDLAIDQGCDFVEPDLVFSKDGVLVVRHENEISETTDVASHPAFADRRTVKVVDGVHVEGWFTEDFTLDELKTLRCRERLPRLRPQNTRFDGEDPILTFEALIALAREGGARRGRAVGLYVEMKHPTYFRALGFSMERAAADALDRHGLNAPEAPVIVECFEPSAMTAMRRLTPVRLGQLIAAGGAPADGGPAYAEMTTPEGLAAIAEYAHAIGPEKSLVTPKLITDAHAAVLRVHAWTYRPENLFLPPPFQRGDDPAAHGDLIGEIGNAVRNGVDGVFCDLPAVARLAIQ
jgi:glycerophosphoryl diester phosphodiesterase